MFDGLFIVSIFGSLFNGIKDACKPTISAENWANKELYHEDLINGVSVEQRMKNVESGKYKVVNNHPEPHRDSVSGKIIIENCELYNDDLINFGAIQTMKWVEQGKYNLSPKELIKEREKYNLL